MTLGNKIRKYRKLNGLTQKELGIKVGFSEETADSRIRKYESDLMALKAAIRNKMAEVLGADLSALSAIKVSIDEDVMPLLFQLEEDFGLKIEKKDDLIYDGPNSDLSKYKRNSAMGYYGYMPGVGKQNNPMDDIHEEGHEDRSKVTEIMTFVLTREHADTYLENIGKAKRKVRWGDITVRVFV